jgi:hypothetical protein
MLEVTRRIHGGKGVLYIYGNYGGDVMNFDMAAEMADMEDIRVETVLVKDDVASAPPAEADRRRGVAGMVYAFKLAGAKAEAGGDLDEVAAIARKTLANTRSIGVALSPCTVPQAGKPTVTIGEGEMEIGMGIHGEPGMQREGLQTADAITERMMDALLEDLAPGAGDTVTIMLNSLGATPLEELYIMFRKAHEVLEARGLKVHRPLHRPLRHLHGDGGRVDHAAAARRRADGVARRAGAFGRSSCSPEMAGMDVVQIRAAIPAGGPSAGGAQGAPDRAGSAMGDGDLGITAGKMAAALNAYVADEPAAADVGAYVAQAGVAINRAASSSLGTLLATAAMRAGKEVRGLEEVAAADLARMLTAAGRRHPGAGQGEAGRQDDHRRAAPGGRRVRCGGGGGPGSPCCREADARCGACGSRRGDPLRSRVGRASWVGERTEGLVDPGCEAGVVILEAIAATEEDL